MAFSTDASIDWYRSEVDPKELSTLMERSDLRGWIQTLAHLGWFFTTATLCYLAFEYLSSDNWPWMLPVLFACLFLHGTMGPFMGLIAIHELQHKTVFKTRGLNNFFEHVYAFISWSDFIWYRYSHAFHHRATCHHDYDGEVVLPLKFNFKFRFWLAALFWDPRNTWAKLKNTWRNATGVVTDPWSKHVLATPAAQREHRRWARILLLGHAALACIFVATGNWFLIIVFTFGTQYCNWLGFLCGLTQHYGRQSNTADFRENTRTFTCSRIVGFYYWNMQYHTEHHMYPAVPFFNLPKLHHLIRADYPTPPHGLRQTWKEILELRRTALSELRNAK